MEEHLLALRRREFARERGRPRCQRRGPPGGLVGERAEAGAPVQSRGSSPIRTSSPSTRLRSGQERSRLAALEQQRVPLADRALAAARRRPRPSAERSRLLLGLAVRSPSLSTAGVPSASSARYAEPAAPGGYGPEPQPPFPRDGCGELFGLRGGRRGGGRRGRYPMPLFRGVAQPGSALRSGRRGPQFESGHPDFSAGAVRGSQPGEALAEQRAELRPARQRNHEPDALDRGRVQRQVPSIAFASWSPQASSAIRDEIARLSGRQITRCDAELARVAARGHEACQFAPAAPGEMRVAVLCLRAAGRLSPPSTAHLVDDRARFEAVARSSSSRLGVVVRELAVAVDRGRGDRPARVDCGHRRNLTRLSGEAARSLRVGAVSILTWIESRAARRPVHRAERGDAPPTRLSRRRAAGRRRARGARSRHRLLDGGGQVAEAAEVEPRAETLGRASWSAPLAVRAAPPVEEAAFERRHGLGLAAHESPHAGAARAQPGKRPASRRTSRRPAGRRRSRSRPRSARRRRGRAPGSREPLARPIHSPCQEILREVARGQPTERDERGSHAPHDHPTSVGSEERPETTSCVRPESGSSISSASPALAGLP